jgi:hypothetical protein
MQVAVVVVARVAVEALHLAVLLAQPMEQHLLQLAMLVAAVAVLMVLEVPLVVQE